MDSKNHFHLLMRSPLWAIRPEHFSALVTMLSSAYIPTWEAAKPSVLGRGENRVALIPIEGTLTKDGPSWLGSSYDTIGTALEAAATDNSVKKVALLVDSPGGDVTGLPETAAMIGELAKVKPVSAMVDGVSASAAYWLTSQASDITLTPSGEVGSVGVRTIHFDLSGMYANEGIKPTELYSGNFKTEWSPFSPLSEEAKTDMQGRLNDVHQLFLDSITAGRGVRATQEIREARFGEGRMLSSKAAVAAGLVDKLATGREFFRALMPPVETEPTENYGFAKQRVQRHELERDRY